MVPVPPSKYIANNEALIGTANWDYSAFTKNREFLYVTTVPAVLVSLQHLAIADLKQVSISVTSFAPQLTVSPGAAPEITPVLNQPGSIDIESEELQPGDPLFNSIAAKGSSARVILPVDRSAREREAVEQLIADGVQVRRLPRKPVYLHAKMIVGERFGWIGSQNFSTTSLNYNREVGIILTDKNDLDTMRSSFSDDWENALPAN